jgi:formylglycine-generating enzyme required for sulfatase activity
MMEWTRDWYNIYPRECQDCANVGNGLPIWDGPRRVMRGGSWQSIEVDDPTSPGAYLSTLRRDYVAYATFRFAEVGVRCARSGP